MTTWKLVLTSSFVSLAIVLPQSLILIGGPDLGAILLPLRILIFICAMLLGSMSGLNIAIIAIIAGVLLRMLPILIASYMVFKHSVYALVSSYLYKVKKQNVYISYLTAKILGMTVSIFVIYLILSVFNFSSPVLTSSLPYLSLVFQELLFDLITIPLVLYLIQRSEFVNDISGDSKKTK